MRKFIPNKISVVIMAGGTGGAFSPISQFMPKSLAWVGTKPIIHRILDSLSIIPIDRVYIILGEFGEMISSYVPDTKSLNHVIHAIEFVRSGKEDRTGGGLLRVKGGIQDTFLVYYGDILLEKFDFSEMLAFHTRMRKEHHVLGTLAYSRSYPLGVGILKLDKSSNLLTEVQEKPTEDIFNVNMGISLFGPGLFNYIKDKTDDLYSTVIPRALSSREKFAVFEHRNRWWHIHTAADLYTELHDGESRKRWFGTLEGSW